MPIPARTRQVQRAALKSTVNGKAPTVLTLLQNPPNNWRWFGNDGHYYSQGRASKAVAITDATGGSLRKL